MNNKNKNIFDLLFWDKRAVILLALDKKEKNFTQLHKEARVVARTLSRALKEFINFGLVKKRRDKRKVFYSLTEKGENVKKKLSHLRAKVLYDL